MAGVAANVVGTVVDVGLLLLTVALIVAEGVLAGFLVCESFRDVAAVVGASVAFLVVVFVVGAAGVAFIGGAVVGFRGNAVFLVG